VRRAKQKFTPLFESGQDSHAARCVPVKLPKRPRKIVKLSRVHDARFTTPSAAALSQHPLLFCKSSHTTTLSAVDDGQEFLSPLPVTSTPLSAMSAPSSGNRESSTKKRHLRAADYDIDNIVVPTSMFQSARITPVKAKQIFTPQFRLAPVLRPMPLDAPVSDGSSDEDTSDEAYYKRHFALEVEERKKYLLKPGDKKAVLKEEQLPSQLYITSSDDLAFASMSPLQSPNYINNWYLDSRMTDSAKLLSFPSASAPVTPLKSMPRVTPSKCSIRTSNGSTDTVSREQVKRKFSAIWESSAGSGDDTSDADVLSASESTDSGEEDDAVLSDELIHSDAEDDDEEVEEDDDPRQSNGRTHKQIVIPTQGMNTRHSATRRPSTVPVVRGRGRSKTRDHYRESNSKQHKSKKCSNRRQQAPKVQWVIANSSTEQNCTALHNSLSLPSLDVSADDVDTVEECMMLFQCIVLI